MKIIMFGAGVINALYGYALAQAGNDVTHYVRPGKKKMLESGISLKFLDGRASPPRQESAHYDAKIVESLSSGDGYELVVVSVRHYQLDSVLPVLKDKIENAVQHATLAVGSLRHQQRHHRRGVQSGQRAKIIEQHSALAVGNPGGARSAEIRRSAWCPHAAFQVVEAVCG